MILVSVGSTLGGVARYSLGQALRSNSSFPCATWFINLIGTLLLGIFTQEFVVVHHDPDWLLLCGTGLCAGFTTFSTMSVESVRLFSTNQVHGVIYLGSSLATGLVVARMPKWLL
ncbi:CrcB family protein [Alicyclobacillus tolerans]|uniref:fluoride efflux transporter FluC n=1 Tax=Alicyclobacillus tolerans TaxID=90970 RepID=UPI0035577D11|nr:CrcB family protein [Alicyclobacillus tolerans]